MWIVTYDLNGNTQNTIREEPEQVSAPSELGVRVGNRSGYIVLAPENQMFNDLYFACLVYNDAPDMKYWLSKSAESSYRIDVMHDGNRFAEIELMQDILDDGTSMTYKDTDGEVISFFFETSDEENHFRQKVFEGEYE